MKYIVRLEGFVLDTLSDSTKKILQRIHQEVYKEINENCIDIFLCGGASKGTYISDRDRIRSEFRIRKFFRIMYPEDLFIDILNRDKQADLLTLEKFLADNCDIICIACESAGALVELGAFVNHSDTKRKVIALVDQSRQKDKSFILLGPIRMLKKQGKFNVIFYDPSDISSLANKICKFSLSKNSENISGAFRKKDIDSIVGLQRFISLLLYFLKNVDSGILVSSIKYLFGLQGYSEKNFDNLFRSSLKLLYKEKTIIKSNNIYQLTPKGFEFARMLMKNAKISRKNRLFDNIRFSIIEETYG